MFKHQKIISVIKLILSSMLCFSATTQAYDVFEFTGLAVKELHMFQASAKFGEVGCINDCAASFGHEGMFVLEVENMTSFPGPSVIETYQGFNTFGPPPPVLSVADVWLPGTLSTDTEFEGMGIDEWDFVTDEEGKISSGYFWASIIELNRGVLHFFDIDNRVYAVLTCTDVVCSSPNIAQLRAIDLSTSNQVLVTDPLNGSIEVWDIQVHTELAYLTVDTNSAPFMVPIPLAFVALFAVMTLLIQKYRGIARNSSSANQRVDRCCYTEVKPNSKNLCAMFVLGLLLPISTSAYDTIEMSGQRSNQYHLLHLQGTDCPPTLTCVDEGQSVLKVGGLNSAGSGLTYKGWNPVSSAAPVSSNATPVPELVTDIFLAKDFELSFESLTPFTVTGWDFSTNEHGKISEGYLVVSDATNSSSNIILRIIDFDTRKVVSLLGLSDATLSQAELLAIDTSSPLGVQNSLPSSWGYTSFSDMGYLNEDQINVE